MQFYRLVLIVCACLIVLPVTAATPPREGLGPQPVAEPVLPQPSGRKADRNEQLITWLLGRQRTIDSRIAELLIANDGLIPDIPIRQRPELDEARRLRDEAWTNLQAQLAAREQGLVARKPEDIEQGPSQVSDAELKKLYAQHRLTVAMAYKDKFVDEGRSSLENLDAGLHLLTTIEDRHLPRSMQPQRRYHIIWFEVERARLLEPGEERDATNSRVGRLVDEFAGAFPGNDLVTSARWLLRMADLEAQVDSSQKRVEEELGPAGDSDAVPVPGGSDDDQR